MYPVSRLFIVTITLLAACAEVPEESTWGAELTQNRITTNRITANQITANRITANRITANRITANRITSDRIEVSSSVDELLATADGQVLFEVIVGCALPKTVTLVARVDGTELEFHGEIGLAPDWLHHALDLKGQGWVTACLLARVNATGIELNISIRGTHHVLKADAAEREKYPLEEGAFYGNVFVPLDQPIVWIACRGADQAAGELGGLVDRDCAEPDPAHPGLTVCGFTFAGDCASFTGETGDAACEQFSENGEFYRRCHSEPIDGPRQGADEEHGRGRGDVFREVITTYVTP
jgi:hypothetical protein